MSSWQVVVIFLEWWKRDPSKVKWSPTRGWKSRDLNHLVEKQKLQPNPFPFYVGRWGGNQRNIKCLKLPQRWHNLLENEIPSISPDCPSSKVSTEDFCPLKYSQFVVLVETKRVRFFLFHIDQLQTSSELRANSLICMYVHTAFFRGFFVRNL